MQNYHLKHLIVAFSALFMIACGGDGADGQDGTDGQDADPLVVESAEAEDCPDGGSVLTFGYDTTGDGAVDEELSSQTVCNGEDGADGTDGTDGTDGADGTDGTDGTDGEDGNSVLTETAPADAADCPNGGTTVTFGYDTTGDDAIDQVLETTNVCNGIDGEDGNSVIAESTPADATACPNGGTTMSFGYDTTGDDAIDQVLETTDICNGIDGEDGNPVLVESAPAASAVCSNGGTTFTFGYDTTGNSSIDVVLDTANVCDGQDGQNGQDGQDGQDGQAGQDGQDGNSVLVESSPAAGGDCAISGTTLTFGYDTTGNGSIDQVLETVTICDGTDPLAAIAGKAVLYVGTTGGTAADQMLAALQGLGTSGTISLTTTTFANLATEIDSGNYDIVFIANRGDVMNPASITSLTTWISSGGAAILSTWETNASLFPPFEATRIGTNLTSATFNDLVLGFGLDAVPVTNNGSWGTYALQLEATGSGYSACTWENDTSCAVIGNGGKTVLLGFLSDTITATDGQRVVRNALWQVSL